MNREDIDFGSVDNIEPAQQFDLVEDRTGDVEYPVKVAKFRSVHHLAVFVSSNFGADATESTRGCVVCSDVFIACVCVLLQLYLLD